MQRLEVSGAVRLLHMSLGVKGLKRNLTIHKTFELKSETRLEWNILLKILLKTWPVLLPTAANFKTFFRPGPSPFINFNRMTEIFLSKLLHRKCRRILRGKYCIQKYKTFSDSFGYIYCSSIRFGNHYFELNDFCKEWDLTLTPTWCLCNRIFPQGFGMWQYLIMAVIWPKHVVLSDIFFFFKL
jgi:hypothetical protein